MSPGQNVDRVSVDASSEQSVIAFTS